MTKKIYFFLTLAVILPHEVYCMKATRFINIKEDNICRGPSIQKKTDKEPETIGRVNRDNVQYDETRDKYYKGISLSQFPVTAQEVVK